MRPSESLSNTTSFPEEWRIPSLFKIIVLPYISVILSSPVCWFITYTVPSGSVSLYLSGLYNIKESEEYKATPSPSSNT